jgi:hypothetical protein
MSPCSCIWIAACCVLMTSQPTSADEALVYTEGGAVSSLADHASIRLVSEYVHIEFRRGSNQVECIFFLENTGPACTVTMGFPSFSHDPGERPNVLFRSFMSYLDGDTVGTVMLPATDHLASANIGSWYTKEVPFDAGQTRCVRDVYEAVPVELGSRLYTFDYILWTGATWAGAIGVVDVVATFESISIPLESILATPADCHRSGNEIRWHFTNLEPRRGSREERISLSWEGSLRR